MQSAVLDTSSGGCHVWMSPIGELLGDSRGRQMFREQISGTDAAQSTDTEDELPELVASDSEAEEDAHRSESSEGRSDNSDETDLI
jgi:hypothetical protein